MSKSDCVALGIDFGLKKIGVAVGQSITGSANPLITLTCKHRKPDWNALDALVAQWQPDAIVLGVPHYADGSDTSVTKAAQDFGFALNERYNLPLHTMDERLSSVEAERWLKSSNKNYSKHDIDKVAAKFILESWFQQYP